MDEEKKKSAGSGDGRILSYIGLGLMLLSFILAVVVTDSTGSDYFTENIILTCVLALAVIVTAAGYLMVGIIVAAVATVVFAGLKIYSITALQSDFPPYPSCGYCCLQCVWPELLCILSGIHRLFLKTLF